MTVTSTVGELKLFSNAKDGFPCLSLTGTELGLKIRGGKSINKFFFETPSKHLFRRKMLCPQYFHNKS